VEDGSAVQVSAAGPPRAAAPLGVRLMLDGKPADSVIW
jgi:hypothetical protein